MYCRAHRPGHNQTHYKLSSVSKRGGMMGFVTGTTFRLHHRNKSRLNDQSVCMVMDQKKRCAFQFTWEIDPSPSSSALKHLKVKRDSGMNFHAGIFHGVQKNHLIWGVLHERPIHHLSPLHSSVIAVIFLPFKLCEWSKSPLTAFRLVWRSSTFKLKTYCIVYSMLFHKVIWSSAKNT